MFRTVRRTVLLNKFAAHLTFQRSSLKCEKVLCCRQFHSVKGELEQSSVLHADNFKTFLKCTNEEAAEILKQNQEIAKRSLLDINKQIVALSGKGVSLRTIVFSPWVLNVSEGKLEDLKLDFIKPTLIREILDELDGLIKNVQKLEPKDLSDFIPLAFALRKNLTKLIQIFQHDKKVIAEGNRIYYFSKHLGIEPVVISHQFASHMFMFFISWSNVERNLDIMRSFNISPQNILGGLWAFRYQPKHVRDRLQKAKDAGRKDLRLWLVACSEERFDKSVARDGNSMEYLSQRLGYDIETTKSIVAKYKPVQKCRVPKVKAILDYLMIEEKFGPHEIASCISILMASPKTIKSRIEMFKSYGLRPQSLYMIRYSEQAFSKRFEKIVEGLSKKN